MFDDSITANSGQKYSKKVLDHMLDSIFLNSSTGTINLHILQNNTSLFAISRIVVGIFPQ
jgi:hypothetical protein